MLCYVLERKGEKIFRNFRPKQRQSIECVRGQNGDKEKGGGSGIERTPNDDDDDDIWALAGPRFVMMAHRSSSHIPVLPCAPASFMPPMNPDDHDPFSSFFSDSHGCFSILPSYYISNERWPTTPSKSERTSTQNFFVHLYLLLLFW